ncbi:hypothetical protein AMTRI_Chr03g147580 [Amborella trichopoda]|uniref:Uncharacterized protein n=1 Tax=Amborella trichopoda TaxID=13333 RepID=W1P378_AMBTC|nr:uncharacterized protein LOC110006835 [Amborella trichopoda]XP_020520083.1 uncharacterized protein LOC110006835 [Amborella trichopoda]ERN01410.1 hypothetical protein AMTR_s00002p00264180 [Amborella trichopoda]|eukprot:XP_020520082.1 uncharacterized protein LOC110006835 [Amborella trichopoda]
MRIRGKRPQDLSPSEVLKFQTNLDKTHSSICREKFNKIDGSKPLFTPPPPSSSSLDNYSSPSSSLSTVTSSSELASESSSKYHERCRGLDLLAQAALNPIEYDLGHVSTEWGSFFGIPFPQRKVIRRRNKASKFIKIGSGIFNSEENKRDEVRESDSSEMHLRINQFGNGRLNSAGKKKSVEREGIVAVGLRSKRSRLQSMPHRFGDSVLQPWKRGTRSRLTD